MIGGGDNKPFMAEGRFVCPIWVYDEGNGRNFYGRGCTTRLPPRSLAPKMATMPKKYGLSLCLNLTEIRAEDNEIMKGKMPKTGLSCNRVWHPGI